MSNEANESIADKSYRLVPMTHKHLMYRCSRAVFLTCTTDELVGCSRTIFVMHSKVVFVIGSRAEFVRCSRTEINGDFSSRKHNVPAFH